MVNFLGPGAWGAANPSATRPPIVPLNGPGDLDDWAKDCSDPLSQDGTEWRAGLFNFLIALHRSLVRKSGVTPSNLDDDIMTRAVRSQAMNYRVAGGSANALTVMLDPVPAAATAGLPLRIYPSTGPNTGAVTLNDGSGAIPLRYVTGADLFPGEIVAGRAIEVLCLGGVWVLLNPVEYFERLTPKRARQTSAFTPNVVISDITGVDTPNIAQSISVSGVTYLDVTAYCAVRNTVSSLVNVIAYTRLLRTGYPDQDSQYLGSGLIDQSQKMTVAAMQIAEKKVWEHRS